MGAPRSSIDLLIWDFYNQSKCAIKQSRQLTLPWDRREGINLTEHPPQHF